MSKKILIVDDFPQDLVLMRLVLQIFETADEVLVVKDEIEALTLLRLTQYDLVLLDIKMQEADELTALALLHAKEAVVPMPVVVISSSASLVSHKRADAAGAVEYVYKSTEYADFCANLRGALVRRGFI